MKAAILTVSDGCYRGQKTDRSGQVLLEFLQDRDWSVEDTAIVPDEIDEIQQRILAWCRRSDLALIVSTGGTGLGHRDVTPDAVVPLFDKEATGLAELMRLRGMEHTQFAALSRSVAGVIHKKIVLCLPGSPAGAVQSLQAVVELIPHAIDITQGRTKHRSEDLKEETVGG